MLVALRREYTVRSSFRYDYLLEEALRSLSHAAGAPLLRIITLELEAEQLEDAILAGRYILQFLAGPS